MKQSFKMGIAGAAAGCINGLFGAGGGMILVPLLSALTNLDDQEIFPSSISIILPICVISLGVGSLRTALPWAEALPYLIGSVAGGILAGLLGQKIPTLWLHRALGLLIVYGGWRYLN